ncbi:MAG: small subunit ribosomal protein [Solirubrobacteraceae bacterium]|nr:small subunit ribosomal protein [Solirubrobacteraceae bacterium]
MADDRTPPEEQPEQAPAPDEQAPAAAAPAAGEEQPAADAPVEVPADEERPHGDPLAEDALSAPAAEQPAAEQPAADAAPPLEADAEVVDDELEDDADETPRVKPEIPGADLEVDIVQEGSDPLARGEFGEDEDGTPGEDDDLSADQPIAAVTIDLAAGARYRATGKRKTAIARVILVPGTGAYTINGRTLDVFFPRPALQRNIRQPLEAVGYAERMDVIANMQGGGVSSQAGALRHGISRALLEADPNLRGELKRRGFLTRDPRVKERKKAGLKKARKRPQFSKR